MLSTVLTLAGSLSILVTLSAAAFSVEAFIPFWKRLFTDTVSGYKMYVTDKAALVEWSCILKHSTTMLFFLNVDQHFWLVFVEVWLSPLLRSAYGSTQLYGELPREPSSRVHVHKGEMILGFFQKDLTSPLFTDTLPNLERYHPLKLFWVNCIIV